jgi:hypothetical protein
MGIAPGTTRTITQFTSPMNAIAGSLRISAIHCICCRMLAETKPPADTENTTFHGVPTERLSLATNARHRELMGLSGARHLAGRGSRT